MVWKMTHSRIIVTSKFVGHSYLSDLIYLDGDITVNRLLERDERFR